MFLHLFFIYAKRREQGGEKNNRDEKDFIFYANDGFYFFCIMWRFITRTKRVLQTAGDKLEKM